MVGSNKAPASFGELALIFGSPRQATVKTTSTASCYRVNRETFRFTMANTAAKAAAAKVSALADVPVLKMLSDSQKALLADATHELHVDAGKKIITKGDDKNVNLFYIISQGTAHAPASIAAAACRCLNDRSASSTKSPAQRPAPLVAHVNTHITTCSFR